jgi:hypothetical protein
MGGLPGLFSVFRVSLPDAGVEMRDDALAGLVAGTLTVLLEAVGLL